MPRGKGFGYAPSAYLRAYLSPCQAGLLHRTRRHVRRDADPRHGTGGIIESASADPMTVRILRPLLLLPVFGLLSGCNMVLMQPSGDIATRQRDLILASTGLMLLIIIPVIVATLFFAWR